MLNQYIKNLEYTEGKTPTFADILGDENNLARLGGFFNENSDLLLLASLHCLLVNYQTGEFNSDEAMAYRKGIDDLMDFLRGSAEEYSRKFLQEEKNGA